MGWHMVAGPGQVGGFGSNGLNGMVGVGGPVGVGIGGMTMGCVGLGSLMVGGDERSIYAAAEQQLPSTASAGSGVGGSGLVHVAGGGWAGGSLRPAAVHGGQGDGKGQKVKARPNRPSVRLTAQLLDTYKRINDKYYRRQVSIPAPLRKRVYNDGYDDESGNYIVRVGDIINGRYQIAIREGGKSAVLGKGSFGLVRGERGLGLGFRV
jgi:hypothetical protein